MTVWKSLYAGMFGVVATATWLSAGSPPGPVHSLEIADRVAKFEAFYAEATAKPLDESARWALWKKEYDIAAVPPGLDGDKMARQLLDSAWVKYPALMPKIPALRKEAKGDAHEAFDKINVLFETKDTAIHSRLVLYVGQFDDNAYTVPPMDGHLATVMMPIENVQLRLALAHELTHSVHIQLAHVSNSFGAPIAETMFLEGIAMRKAHGDLEEGGSMSDVDLSRFDDVTDEDYQVVSDDEDEAYLGEATLAKLKAGELTFEEEDQDNPRKRKE